MTSTTAPRLPAMAPVLVGGGVLLAFFATDTALCPTRVCTGYACPGCGMTRALWNGVTGDFATSWRYHPLAAIVAIQGLLWLVLRRFAPERLTPKLTQTVLIADVVLLCVVWVIRWRLGLLDFVLGE